MTPHLSNLPRRLSCCRRPDLFHISTWHRTFHSSHPFSLPSATQGSQGFSATEDDTPQRDSQLSPNSNLDDSSRPRGTQDQHPQNSWADLLHHLKSKQSQQQQDRNGALAAVSDHAPPAAANVAKLRHMSFRRTADRWPKRSSRQHMPDWEDFPAFVHAAGLARGDVAPREGDVAGPGSRDQGGANIRNSWGYVAETEPEDERKSGSESEPALEPVLTETEHGEVQLHPGMMRQIESIGSFKPRRGKGIGFPTQRSFHGEAAHPELWVRAPVGSGNELDREGDMGLEDDRDREAWEDESSAADVANKASEGEVPSTDVWKLVESPTAPLPLTRYTAFLSGLPGDVTPEDVQQAVGAFGNIGSIHLKSASGGKAAFAFIHFMDKGSLLHAVAQHTLTVKGCGVGIQMSHRTKQTLLAEEAGATSAGHSQADTSPNHPMTPQTSPSGGTPAETTVASTGLDQHPSLRGHASGVLPPSARGAVGAAEGAAGSAPGNEDDAFVVKLSRVPPSASLVEIKQALQAFGSLVWVKINPHPDEESGPVEVSACFKSEEARVLALTRGHIRLKGWSVAVLPLDGDRGITRVRIVKDAVVARDTLELGALKEACAALVAPVSSFTVRSKNVVDVTFRTKLSWPYVMARVRRADLPGWRPGRNGRLTITQSLRSSPHESRALILSMRKAVSLLRSTIEECTVELEDIEMCLDKLDSNPDNLL